MSAPAKPAGGPAFPIGEKYTTTDLAGNTHQHSKGALHPGMTLRDYFAAQVAAGDAASDGGWGNGAPDDKVRARAKLYYRIADAMLAEREAS